MLPEACVKKLSSHEGEEALGRLPQLRALFAFDFDGTLAPIVLVPDQARMTTGVARRLARLSQLAPVAVISGRSLSDLRARIPPEVLLCVGNHGSEATTAGPDVDAMRQTCSSWMSQLRERLGGDDGDGIIVENKGVTLSVHFRMARDRTRAEQLIAGWIEELVPRPRVIGGKFVFNLLPQQARDKFEALVDIAERTGVDTVVFVGDDLTDEIVFEQAPPHWITVRVERHRDSRAQFYIHDQSDVAILLDRLIAMLETREPQRQQRGGDLAPPGR
jgi:trehalose 6-phosphate phosphatase